MNNTLPYLAGRIFGTPLAITLEKADEILSAIGPRLLGGAAAIPLGVQQRGDYQVSQEGIAVIEITGTLVSKASGMEAESGLTSYADIAADFWAAIADPMVRAILLHIDTPGGEVAGMFELADTMYCARGQKRSVPWRIARLPQVICSRALPTTSLCRRRALWARSASSPFIGTNPGLMRSPA
ncbi:MAG: hypothetical protein WDO73_02670 [Ignavibacteriota bacterium]